MVYIERLPHPKLVPFIRCFWYTYDPLAQHALERVLPEGHLQIVMGLGRDHLTDRSREPELGVRPSAAALLVGIHSRYQVIDSFDMGKLIGVVFRPARTIPFFLCRSGPNP